MIKAIIEIDNRFASSWSIIKYIEKYIFKNSILKKYNNKKAEVIYNIYDENNTFIAKIKLKNLRQE